MATSQVSSLPSFRVSGMISSVDHWPLVRPTRYTALIRMPASSPYETPPTVEVTSDAPIGNEGQLVDLVCTLSGRYRSYPVKDRDTGEMRTVRTADNILTVVRGE